MIPNLAIVKVQNPHWRNIRLWLPLFLLWIPLLLLSPMILLVLLVCCIAGGIDFFAAIKTFWGILVGLPGTDVHVTANGNKITVRIL
jgi:hypothetical protein